MAHPRTPVRRTECRLPVGHRSALRVSLIVQLPIAKSTHRLGNLLGVMLELLVQSLPAFPLLLLQLDFVLIAVSILPLPVSCLVKLDVGSFSVYLDVLGLLLANHNRGLQVHVNDHDHFVVARLEEEVLDVAEEDI